MSLTSSSEIFRNHASTENIFTKFDKTIWLFLEPLTRLQLLRIAHHSHRGKQPLSSLPPRGHNTDACVVPTPSDQYIALCIDAIGVLRVKRRAVVSAISDLVALERRQASLVVSRQSAMKVVANAYSGGSNMLPPLHPPTTGDAGRLSPRSRRGAFIGVLHCL